MSTSQRAIAKAAGVCQTTVSLALRGDVSIPPATRDKVARIAVQLGYRANPYVASLMSRIRASRRARTTGCIALVADAADEDEWLSDEIYRFQYDGMRDRAAGLGFRTEPFFLRRKGMSPHTLDRILRTRGIRGMVLAGQKQSDLAMDEIRWDDFACATISYTWDSPEIDRVCANHRRNLDLVLRRVSEFGYKRIGLCLRPVDVNAVDHGWTASYLVWSHRLGAKDRLPIFVAEHEDTGFRSFALWFERWKPDVVITKLGVEEKWLARLGLRVPEDVGLACFNRRSESQAAGVEECHSIIGSTVIELVAAQIVRNEYGPPPHPRLTLINGEWEEGKTLRAQG